MGVCEPLPGPRFFTPVAETDGSSKIQQTTHSNFLLNENEICPTQSTQADARAAECPVLRELRIWSPHNHRVAGDDSSERPS